MRSLWAEVAHRYGSERRELRAEPLGSRFWASFSDGVLELTMANGVQRRVDRDELRACFRVLAAGAGPEAVRLVTANGAYLSAIRDDLGSTGYDPGSLEAEGADDEPGDVESRLVEEAVARTRDSSNAPSETEEESEPESELAALRAALDAERTDKEGLVREQARLTAAVADLESRLVVQVEHARGLEQALERARAKPAQAPTVGRDVDFTMVLAVAKSEVATSGVSELVTKAVREAADLAPTDPGLAVVKCRIVLEELARSEWKRVFRTDELPAYSSFGSLMQDLKDQPSVDEVRWNVQRTLYRVANAGAHELRSVSFRRAAAVVLVTAQLVASRTP